MPMLSEPGTQNATEEETLAYEYFYEQALAFIHADESADFVINKIKESGDVIVGISEVVAVIYRRLEVKNPQEKELLQAVAMEVIEDIIAELLEMAVLAGFIQEEEVNEQVLGKIMEQAVAKYLEIESAEGVDPEQKKSQLQQLSQSEDGKKAIDSMSEHAKSNLSQWMGEDNG